MYSEFEGQQEGERILYTVSPHPLVKTIAITRILVLALVFFIITYLISPTIGIIALVISIVLVAGGIWWNTHVYKTSKTYLTDRRVYRIEVVSPFFQTKRALFWTEALKAKGYAPNMFWRMLKIGTVEIQPHLDTNEGVRITDVYFFEDLANYIDKILYLVKNNPGDIPTIRPFIPKPAGSRT
ncbi:hypothetical protein A2875_04135 [Candidatus Gottesmanbacteria bacterium RIFCSPHIGHO2_01_FULL_46_14]|uniref:DUF304 domain-containing protein n=3 Tax=Microgenomates group TaxID=1794810 RepID=A0A1F5ZSM1_9BACT|nr:MAG: hypothetical protein UU34_C0014G0009 [Candidatus Curtissbacteria bacterium GW2011_GWA1_41_11]OGG15449.1 MAG: hypothetical protein A2875_04135 [Candidatus Gottesmanbacteria bacterium RIFCSPHIGHO2_01_FULL_46_14]OGG30201.1 MAG: hypothetical protein A2971_04075 [Candidatus Gottesmanbacteria bacterium RIFCSPLOWO2_01_FULL_46_21]